MLKTTICALYVYPIYSFDFLLNPFSLRDKKKIQKKESQENITCHAPQKAGQALLAGFSLLSEGTNPGHAP